MRLHKIQLKNYRGVADCTVEFPEHGVTVIEGDNEVGKTCIPEALGLILNYLDDSKRRAVNAVKPVGRNAGAEVTVEFSSGSYRLKYFKRWHRKNETALEVFAPHKEQLTGRQAHEKVEAILNDTLDRTLWDALIIKQGSGVGLPQFGCSTLGAALDQAAGGEAFGGDGEDDLWQRVEGERAKYCTPTGQPNADRKKQSKDLAELQANTSSLSNSLNQIQANADEANSLQLAEAKLEERYKQASQDVTDLSERWQATEELRNQAKHLKSDHGTAQDKLKMAEDAHSRRQELIQQVQSHEQNQTQLQAEAQRSAPELARVMQRNQEAKQALEATQTSLTKAQDALRQANEDRDYLRNVIERQQLAERQNKLITAERTLGEAEALLDASQVDEEWLEQVEQAKLQVVSHQAALQASAVAVEVTALAATAALLDGKQVTLASGEVTQTDVTDTWDFQIPDTVHIKVQPGNSYQELAAAVRSSENDYERLCQIGEVATVEQARRKIAEQQEAEIRRKTAQAEIKESLRDLTPEVLAQKAQNLEKRVAEYPTKRSSLTPLPDDFEQAKQIAAAAEEAEKKCRVAFESAQASASQANNEIIEAQRTEATDAQKLESAGDALELAQQKLKTKRASQPDDELQAAQYAATVNLQAATSALQQVNTELQALDIGTLDAKLKNARNVQAKAEKELQTNQNRQVELRGRLEAQGEAGLHSELNQAASKLEHTTRQQNQTEKRARAAELLHQIFHEHRQQARQRYMTPFKSRIDQLGRIVFGPSFEVELNEDLKPVKRTLNGTTLDVEQLSVGAQEQLSVISRLACAAIVSPSGGGVPVVIDDALGWSDPSRLAAMGTAIATASTQSQVILLTCTPDRYSHVGNASVVRLPIADSVSNP